MCRFEKVQEKVNEILLSVTDLAWRRKFYIHLYGVSQCSVLLAEKRGFDPEVAAVIGLLHDISAVAAGNYDDHCNLSAQRGCELLNSLGLFSDQELSIIRKAIANHDDRMLVNDDYDELLKDADILHPHLLNPLKPPGKTSAVRLALIKRELGISQ